MKKRLSDINLRCRVCGFVGSTELFRKDKKCKYGRTTLCKKCTSIYYRKKYVERNMKIYNAKYRKTKKGFLISTYANMKTRVDGKHNLKSARKIYKGLPLLSYKDFFDWSIKDKSFNVLFGNWTDNNFLRKLTPSVDRIDPTLGYVPNNIQWLTHSENVVKGLNNRWRKIKA